MLSMRGPVRRKGKSRCSFRNKPAAGTYSVLQRQQRSDGDEEDRGVRITAGSGSEDLYDEEMGVIELSLSDSQD